jgi:carbonic anhydrase/acetyltransferase-like protein (isoleucine patch superfamily)
VGGVGDVAEESVGDGVGLVSVGDGSEVGQASVGEGSAVGLGSVGEGSAVGLGSVGEGSAVGLGSVGEGSVEGGGPSVGAQATGRSDRFWVGVGSPWATARPPRADPKTAVAATIART